MLADASFRIGRSESSSRFHRLRWNAMVWRSQRTGTPLPERVAGSEWIYAISQWAAQRQQKLFFLGGAPGVAQQAADKLSERYEGLQIVGVESPPFRPLSEVEQQELLQRVNASMADILFVAMGQPKGEKWIFDNLSRLAVPVSVQLGASFDFVAGGVSRAPKWMQLAGMEWLYRMLQEPGRLAGRYANNLRFLIRATLREVLTRSAVGPAGRSS